MATEDEQIIKGAAGLGVGIATANPVGIVLGVAGLLSSLGEQRRAKKEEERAEKEAAESREAYLSYAERFDNPMQPGSTRAIARALEQNPALMLGGNSPFSNLPAFSEYPFRGEGAQSIKNISDPNSATSTAQNISVAGFSSELSQGNKAGGLTANMPNSGNITVQYDEEGNVTNNQQIFQAMSEVDIFGPDSLLNNIDGAQIQKALDTFNIIGNGKLDIPYWELQAGFNKVAKETNYKSTNPDSEYYDPEAEYTGTQTPDVQRDENGNIILTNDNLFSEEFKEQINTPEFKEAAKQSIEKLQEPYKDENGNVDTEAFLEAMNDKDGAALIDAGIADQDGNLVDPNTGQSLGINVSQLYPQSFTVPGSGGTGGGGGAGNTGGFVFSGQTNFPSSMKDLYNEPLGAQLYVDSEIENPYGRFRDLSSIAQDRSDLFTGANDRRNLLVDRSGMIEDTTGFLNDLRRGARDFSGLATDTSTLASNTFANLQVATQAADIQAQQTDQALANTLSTIRATGAGAGGATAIAQAALQSKQSISATIEQQEARNTQLRAQGQQQVEQIRMNESRRLQEIALGERLRLEGLREREGLRLDTAAQQEAQRLQQIRFGEARRIDDTSFDEAGRIQQAQLAEAIRQQNIQLAEQQALREADIAGIQYQQGLAFDMAQRNLDRLSGLATQSMVNQQAARASNAALGGAVAGGLFELAGSLFRGGN
jgi:hypothetical protein